MEQLNSKQKQRWPKIVAIISILNAAYYLLLISESSQRTEFGALVYMVIIVLMILGSVGLFILKSWGRDILILASWLVLIPHAFNLATILFSFGFSLNSFSNILRWVLPGMAWPVFLLIWLWRHKLQDLNKQ